MEKLRVHRFSSKIVHSNPWYSVRHDKIKWPNGSKGDYYVLQSSGRGSVITVSEQGQRILVLEQFRYPSGTLSVEFSGGMLPRGENIIHCAQRELIEETGYRARTLKKVGKVLLDSTFSDYPLYIVAGSSLRQVMEPQPESDELKLKPFWVTRNGLNEMVRTGKMRDASSLAAWALYEAWRNRR